MHVMASTVIASIIYASFIQSQRSENEQKICSSHITYIGDISLNPGPVYNNDSLDSNEWNAFKSKGIRLIYLKVNSFLPKIDKISYIAEHTNAAVIGITESKLD